MVKNGRQGRAGRIHLSMRRRMHVIGIIMIVMLSNQHPEKKKNYIKFVIHVGEGYYIIFSELSSIY